MRSRETTLDRLPLLPFLAPHPRRAPGLQPLDLSRWLIRDNRFAAQMALRDRLIAEVPEQVVALLPEGSDAAGELRSTVLAWLAGDRGYRFDAEAVTRPDGVEVPLSGPPLELLARLVQEDLLLLLPGGNGEYHLVGGTLLFPARWSLQEKLGRGLEAIHGPVPAYAGNLARRVGRVFEALHPDRPVWRANWLVHDGDALFQPAREAERPPRRFHGDIWIRVERQSLRRLPRSRAVVFAIKTDIAALGSLTAPERDALAQAVKECNAAEYRHKGGDRLVARLEQG